MNNTTNTSGAIANAKNAMRAAPDKKTPAQMMNAILGSEATKKMLSDTCKENAGAFTASVLELYSSDKALQQCDPKLVFMECMKAASLKLPINKTLGFAYIVPYKGAPTMQIGYKGLVQLAMRTGAYKYINSGVVFEGEFKSIDKLTGNVDISGEKLSEEIIGYFAYIETINGFSKALYWAKPQVLNHAAKYSASYNSNSAIWRDHFDEMAQKTVLRNLISKWGVMSVEMVSAMEEDRSDMADKVIVNSSNDQKESILIESELIEENTDEQQDKSQIQK